MDGVNLNQTILIVGGGIESLTGIDVARELGLKVVVLDGNPSAPARYLADGFIHASVYDDEEAAQKSLKYACKSPIHGVIAIACDATVTVSRIASVLQIPGQSMETAGLATNKLLMKRRFQEHGVPIPWFSEVKDIDHLKEISKNAKYPLVIKPVDSRGARGVIRLGKSVELEWAYSHALSFSTSKQVIVEQWIEGPQISTESVIWDGCSVLCGTGDRNYSRLNELFPFVVEDGGGCPSFLSPKLDLQFDAVMAQAAEAIGLRRGTIKGDLVVTENGEVIVIEVATRLSGGYFCTHTIPLVYGINLIGAAMQMAIGRTPDLKSLSTANVKQYQANRFLFLRDGIVKSIRNVDRVSIYPWVKLLEIYVKEGDRVSQATDHTKRAGTVLTVGDNRDIAHCRAQQAIDEIEVVLE